MSIPPQASPSPTELAAIESTLTTWGQLSAYLLDVKSRGTWRMSAPSFTVWVKECARRLLRTEASLWRCIASGRFYRARATVLLQRGTALPDLPYLPPDVSPESLELLAKISRIAPAPLLEEIELKALQGEMARGELRDIWETYRPVLRGRNARGRNTPVPRFDECDPGQRMSRAEADSLMALRKEGSAWTGHPGAEQYVVFPMDHPLTSAQAKELGIDAVMAVQASKGSNLELHGVQFRATTGPHDRADFLPVPAAVDAAWVVLIGITDPDLSAIPDSLGVLTTTRDKATVLRPAALQSSEPVAAREALLRALLLRSMSA
jgi:hypothetical protein